MKTLKILFALCLIPCVGLAATLSERLMSPLTATREQAKQEADNLTPEQLNGLVSDLVHTLKKKDDPDAREHAAQALSLLGPAAKGALGPLRHALDDDFPYVRIHSAEALIKIGPAAIPALTEALKNPNGEIRSASADALGNFGEDAKDAIPGLVKLIQDKELSVRSSAIVALGKMGPSAASALPALQEAAKDSDASIASKAAQVIHKIEAVTIGQKPKAPTPDPTKLLSQALPQAVTPAAAPVAHHPAVAPKKKAPVKSKAAKKAKAPVVPPPATPDELLALMLSTDTVVKSNTEAAIILRSSETMPVLLAALQGPATLYMDISADLLDKIGTLEAKKASEAYRQKKKDKHMTSLLKDLRQEGKTADDAAKELAKMGATVVKPVSQLLSDPRAASRRAAAGVLNQLGSASQPATPALSDALDDWDDGVRHESAEALAKIGTPEAKKALRFFSIKDKVRHLINTVHPMTHS